MQKARLVAQLLMKRFMAAGQMAAIPQRLGSVEEGFQLAAAKQKEEAWRETEGFSGLAVQSVGYEDGVENPRVVVYVSKGSKKELRRMPSTIDGVDIEVMKIGLVSLRPDQAAKLTREPNIFSRKNRVACGGSCGASGGDPGTFGAIVKMKDVEGLFMLSANHVLAGCNHIPPGMPIMAPASDDGRPGAPLLPQSIAELTKTIPLHSGDPRHVTPCEEDVALGRILRPNSVSSWQGGEDGYDTPSSAIEPKSRLPVKKVGRTTGLTTGCLYTVAAEAIPIPCNAKNFKGNVWFKNVWYVVGYDVPFALPGDSGSLVVTEDGKNAVGLLFSSSAAGNVGVIIPIGRLIKELGLTLVSGHGL